MAYHFKDNILMKRRQLADEPERVLSSATYLLQDIGKCCEAGNGRSLVTSMFWRPLQFYPCFISLVPMSLTPSMLSFLTQELQKGLWQRVGADAVPGTDGRQIGSGFCGSFPALLFCFLLGGSLSLDLFGFLLLSLCLFTLSSRFDFGLRCLFAITLTFCLLLSSEASGVKGNSPSFGCRLPLIVLIFLLKPSDAMPLAPTTAAGQSSC